MYKLKSKRRRLIDSLPLMLACAGLFGCHSVVHATDVKPDQTSCNDVEIRDGSYSVNGETTSTDDDYDLVYGGGSEDNPSNAVNNSVEIFGGNVANASGGVAFFSADDAQHVGDVFNNEVIIRGGRVGTATGGEIAFAFADDSADIPKSYFDELDHIPIVSNRLRIKDGALVNIAIGGAAYTGNVNNNVVDLNGGTVRGEVIAGWITDPVEGAWHLGDNTVNINGNIDLTEAQLIGGLIGRDSNRSYRASGNTLNLNTTGITARSINGFENINFNLPSEARAGSTVLTLTEGETKLGGMYLTVSADGASNLTTNDELNLIANINGINVNDSSDREPALSAARGDDDTKTIGKMSYSGVMHKGGPLDYDLTLTPSGDGTAFLASVGELISVEESVAPPDPIPIPILKYPIKVSTDKDKDMFEDTQATDTDHIHEQRGFEMFGNMGGGHFKVKTGDGSHIKTDMTTYDFGFARDFRRNSSVLTIAPVFEYGYGKYDSYLASGIHGSGHQRYLAGGLIVRSFNNSGFYCEGSLRGGQTRTT